MKKQILLFILAMLPMVAKADESGSCGDNLTWTYEEATKTLTISGSGAMWDYDSTFSQTNAPWGNYYQGMQTVIIKSGVASIGISAFYGCRSLISITIPNSVTSIGHVAFYGCSNLTSITIPNSVTSIGYRAFFECANLTSIIIPNSVTSIGSYAFDSCVGLTSITFPNSVTSIGDGTFIYCSGLTSITIPEGVTNIGDMAFCWCSGLTSVTIPNSVTSIGYGAFSGCSDLTSITIPEGVTSIGDYAFSMCYSLTSINIPNSATSIGDNAFQDCSSLTSVAIKCPTVGPWFSGFTSIKEVTLVEGVTNIGQSAFRNCSGLTSITIPNSVTSIEQESFSLCPKLASIKVESGNSVYDSRSDCNAIIKTETNELILGCQNTIIPNSVISIGASAFYGCSYLSSITIPNSVISIGASAFYGCSYLSSITIPNSVTNIGSRAFEDCSWLTSITIPNSVTSIGDYVFSSCSLLTSITIPNSVTSIGDYAFSSCSRLTSINIPNSMTSIGRCAFFQCYSLTSITIPEGVTSIGNSAFSMCSDLTSVTSYIMEPFSIGDFVFSSSTYNNGILYVPGASIGAYETTDGWKNFKNILSFDVVLTTTLITVDDNGSDLTDQVNVTWYNTEGKEIGMGKSLSGIEEGTELFYSVTFGEELGRVYREVNMHKVVVESDTLTCQLKKIGRVQLEGRVSATDIDKTTMTVNIKQMLNGKWEQAYTTQTNEQGVFKVEVYDDVTDITISGDGYLDATLHRDGFGDNGNVGVIPMSLISGFAIAVNITVQKAVAEGETEEATTWTGGLNNIDFTLTNTTKGATITDFTVQNGNVIIKTGAGVGDNISLTAKSKQGVFADATTTFTLVEGANAFDLQLTELGGLDATFAASANGSTSGYLYDNNGVLAAKGSYVGETLSLRHLQSGNYTLVSMGNSMLLGSMTRLSDIAATGLREGSDYVTSNVTVADGKLAAVSVSEVPRLDESQFYYTSDETYFSANKASVTAGNYLTLQAHVDFKQKYADKANGVTLTIDLPEGCEMVENSVIANRQAVAHTISGNRVTMSLSKEQWQSQVRFCIIPTLNQNYTITAMAQFDIDGQVTQPIGTAQFEAKGLSLSVPKLTASTNVTISGTAKGHSEVSIYDNDVLIGKTSSKADGTWTTECELYKPYSLSFHDIYAKITTENGMELTSETQQVEYDKNSLVPEKVTMTYYNGWYKENKTVVFDFLSGTSSPSSWPFYSATDFTFLADFTRNDSTVIKNVNIKVLNSDGTVRTLPATFDGKQNCWVATTKYSSSSRLPKNVKVEYDLIKILEDENREDALLNNATKIVAFANHIKNFTEENMEFDLAEDNEQYLKFECRINGSDNVFDYYVEALNFLDAEKMMSKCQFIYAKVESDTIAVYTEYDDNEISVVNVNLTANLAFRIKIATSDEVNANAVKKVSSIEKFKYLTFNGNFIRDATRLGGYIFDFMGVTSYLSVGDDFNNMRNIIVRYLETYEKAHENIISLLTAKCPNGNFRLSKDDMSNFNNALNAISDVESAFADQYYVYLQEYKKKLAASVLTFGVTYPLGKLFGTIGKCKNFVLSEKNQTLKNILNKFLYYPTTRQTVADIFGNALGLGLNAATGITNVVNGYQNFNAVRDKTLSWASTENADIINNFTVLRNAIKDAYNNCEKKSDDEDYDNSGSNESDFKGKGSTPQIDPSGYVYEAVMSNRLEGVTATCYQKVQVEDMYGDTTEEAVVWNAEDYSQVNPQLTDKTGFYRWDVPQGLWQVKYEKEGYETAYSDWLPVPPPQLDVNIGMKQSTPPTVEKMRGFESGINIEMAKYMRPETMITTNITVTRNGAAEKGSIELLNTEKAPLGEETYVSKVKFVPERRFNTSDHVVVTVHKEVESYCGVKMTTDHVETVKIEPEVKSIVCDSLLTIPYQGTKELRVLVLPKDASAGKTLHVKTSSQMIASLSSEEVTIDQNGIATLTLGGELPGGAVLDYSVSGTDVTATSKVKVVMNRELVAMPTANISSGEAIESGTQLVLTCETEGATIYYTLDGSCPCDEATRYKYEGPISIDTDVIVKAIAVKDGMDDSEIVTFIYIVTGIQAPALAKNLNITCTDGLMTVAGAEGCTVQVFDLAGRNLASRQKAGRTVTLRVPQSEVYIVSVTTKDGQTVVRKMTGR